MGLQRATNFIECDLGGGRLAGKARPRPWLLEIVLAKYNDGRSVDFNTPPLVGQHPRFGPFVDPPRVSFNEPDARVARGISGKCNWWNETPVALMKLKYHGSSHAALSELLRSLALQLVANSPLGVGVSRRPVLAAPHRTRDPVS